MSDNVFDFDIDNILAEFLDSGDDTQNITPEVAPTQPPQPIEPAPYPADTRKYSSYEECSPYDESSSYEDSYFAEDEGRTRSDYDMPRRPSRSADTPKPYHHPADGASGGFSPKVRRPDFDPTMLGMSPASGEHRPARRSQSDAPRRGRPDESERRPARRTEDENVKEYSRRRPVAPKMEDAYEDEHRKPSFGGKKSRFTPAALGGKGIGLIVFTFFLLLWIGLSYHPDAGIRSASTVSRTKVDLVSKLNTYTKNLSVRSASGVDGAELPPELAAPHYDPLSDDTLAPRPDASLFATISIDEADKLIPVIEQARASGLLDGQDVIFNPDTDFYWDSDIEYYCDDTILVICWKEQINERVTSCVEIKIADGSQIRRKLTDDYFGSGVLDYATAIARSANAVVAMNADFYAFRPIGTVIYNGEICRFDTKCDLLLIGPDGNFNFMYAKDIGSQESLQQYIGEHNIRFGLAFGPVIIDNGEIKRLPTDVAYADGMGEMWQEYSRAGIGQFDTLHYLYMAVNHSNDGTPRANVNEFADIMASKGIKNAYNLDGGQTSEVVFRDKPYNHVDYGNERLVSDILYFATAVPEKEGE